MDHRGLEAEAFGFGIFGCRRTPDPEPQPYSLIDIMLPHSAKLGPILVIILSFFFVCYYCFYLVLLNVVIAITISAMFLSMIFPFVITNGP